MFGLSSQDAFILGVGALWVFSAAVGALPSPNAQSSAFYQWLFKFLKVISGDLGSVFGKYIPPTSTTPIAAFFLLGILVLFSGCAHNVNTPLPQGAINQPDAETNAVLQAGHAAADRYETDVKNGFVPSASLKVAVANLVKALNIADPLYQAWHATLLTNAAAPQPAALPSAVSQVSASLTAVNNVR